MLLLAYLEDELEPELTQLIASNGYLLHRAMQLAKQEQRLKMWLAPHQQVAEPGSAAILGRIRTIIGRKRPAKPDGLEGVQLAWRGAMPLPDVAADHQQQFQAGEHQLLLSCHLPSSDRDRLDLITAIFSDHAFTTATLWQGQTRIAMSSSRFDEFTLADLDPGQYLLAITSPNQCVLLPELKLPF